MGSGMLAHWYFYIPDIVLALLMYVTAARLALSFFIDPGADNVFNRALLRATEPAVSVVRIVTPHFVSARFVLAFSCLWLLFLRFVLRYGFARLGLGPFAG